MVRIIKESNDLDKYNRRYVIDDLSKMTKEMDKIKSDYPKMRYEEEVVEGKNMFKVTYNGKTYHFIPISLSQFDVLDDNFNIIDTHIFVKEIGDEIFNAEDTTNYIYKIVGGKYAGEYQLKELMRLPIFSGEFTDDYTDVRKQGGLVHREELDNQPILDGLVGPMYDEWRKNHTMVIRYETKEMYDMLSR